jgi:hypothetical protein
MGIKLGSLLSVCCALALAAQAPSAKKWTPTRTPDGQPDLQGTWSYATVTPLERPAELAGKAVLTAQEAVEYEQRLLQQVSTDRRDGGGEVDVGRSYNESWRDRGRVMPDRRTSLIVAPPDGRIPALTPEARKLAAARDAVRRQNRADGPEDRSLWERCLTRGLPMAPRSYNNNFQIFQTSGYVAILQEMIHEVRIVPLDGRPHLPANIRSWMGDSRGHWEGNTLVVDTTNFIGKSDLAPFDQNLHLVERFKRVDPDTILYEFTVDDPTVFTKPWSAQISTSREDAPIYEYACHEGNYAMTGILGGARAQEKKTAAAVK